MPTIKLPLPSFWDLPHMGGNVTASPLIPSHVATTSAPGLPSTLEELLPSPQATTSPSALANYNSTVVEVSEETLRQLCRKGENKALCI
jgi:hypothetical protein